MERVTKGRVLYLRSQRVPDMDAQNSFDFWPDERLMQAYADGDYSAFDELYGRHAKKVYTFLKRRTGSGPKLHDSFQEVFLRLHRSRARYDATLPFLPWLFAITRNVVVDYLRSLARNREDAIEQIDGGFELPENRRHEKIGRLREQYAELSAPEREVLALRFGNDLAFDKIAARLGISESAGRQMVSRTIRKLRALLGGEVK